LKTIFLVSAYILFWLIFNNIALDEWMKEKAEQTSGILLINRSTCNKSIAKEAKLEIGKSRINLIYNNSLLPPMFDKIDSYIKLKNVNGDIFLTTDVHDKTGALIVNIIDNHWTVSDSQAVLWEKNFTNDSLEIKDKRGHIVLQVELLCNRVRIQGEWWDEYGNGVRYVQQHFNSSRKGGVAMVKLDKDNHPKEPHIKPIFKYPSNKYFGKKIDSSDTVFERIFLLRILEKP